MNCLEDDREHDAESGQNGHQRRGDQRALHDGLNPVAGMERRRDPGEPEDESAYGDETGQDRDRKPALVGSDCLVIGGTQDVGLRRRAEHGAVGGQNSLRLVPGRKAQARVLDRFAVVVR
jgi:hypothetical protein